MKRHKSQIAVIITFVIAMILLFIAVFINLSKVSQVKTTTSTAADKAALSLASQLGSMSHYYKDKVLKISEPCIPPAPCKKCGPGWIVLGLVVLATAVVSFFLPPVGAFAILLGGAGFAAYITTSMLGGIDNKFNEMTLYNSLRERALFETLISTQSDDVEYKAKTEGSGIFYEDSNGNGVFDAGEPEYDLRDIPEMLNAKKVSRFLVWYYKKRIPLVSDDGIKLDLDTFINNLKSFTDTTDEWSGTEWKIKKLSYVLKQLSTVGGSSDYEITCNMGSPNKCPDWVKDKATEQLRIVRIDSSDNAYGGFLEDKLISLLNRLEGKYNGTFCAGTSCKIKPTDVNNLIEDLRRFLAGCKDVFNLPISERLRNITQWFPVFYDSKAHKPDDKSSLDSDLEDDIYERLARDQNYLNTWIAELEKINGTAPAGNISNNIVDTIRSKHGECTWGRGPSVSSTCYGSRGPNCDASAGPGCGCYSCSDDPCCGCKTCCYGKISPCAWQGTYYTCDQDPPVCSNGDLYGAVPGWCSSHADHAVCNSSCGCSVQNFNDDDEAKNFQGQLSWRPPMAGNSDGTDKPTEVEQATRILSALKDDLAKIHITIGVLANAIEAQLPDDSPLRNELIYAWKDKSQFSHLVSAAIDGYPKQLPHVTENSTWERITETCRILEDYVGDFTITAWRYDQDQPTDIAGWKLRRRKKGPLPEGKEFYVSRLNEIVSDIQDNAQIDYPLNKEGIEDLLTYFDYEISSTTTVHYGPEKSDIKIIKTEGD